MGPASRIQQRQEEQQSGNSNHLNQPPQVQQSRSGEGATGDPKAAWPPQQCAAEQLCLRGDWSAAFLDYIIP